MPKEVAKTPKDDAKLPKPKMKGLLQAQIQRNFILLGASILVAGIYMRFIFGDGRKAKHREFYKNYDIEKEFMRMKSKGLFDSCDVIDPVEEDPKKNPKKK